MSTVAESLTAKRRKEAESLKKENRYGIIVQPHRALLTAKGAEDLAARKLRVKFSVPGTMKMGEATHVIRQNLMRSGATTLEPEQAAFFILSNNVIPSPHQLVQEIWKESHDPETQMINVHLCAENAFGAH